MKTKTLLLLAFCSFATPLLSEDAERHPQKVAAGAVSAIALSELPTRMVQIFKKHPHIYYKSTNEAGNENETSWRKLGEYEFAWDLQNQSYFSKTILFPKDGKGNLSYSVTSQIKDVSTQIVGSHPFKKFADFDVSKRMENSYVRINKREFSKTGSLFSFYYEPTLVDKTNILSSRNEISRKHDKKFGDVLEISASITEASVTLREQLLFDAKTGFYVYNAYYRKKDGVEKKLSECEYKEHKEVNGIVFPRVKIRRSWDMDGKYSNSGRSTIDVDSFSADIESVRKNTSFVVYIPVGTTVYDRIRRLTYPQPAINESTNEEFISKELDAVFEKAKKSK